MADPRTLVLRPAVDLWIDPICPWCLIGVTQLERAAASLGLDIEPRLRAFRLHPEWPADGMGWRQFQAHRDLPDAVFDRVAEAGAREGLAFDFPRIARVPDTTPLHRILISAAWAGRAMVVYRAFADSYFFRFENLADPAVVSAAARRGGLGEDRIQAALSDPAIGRRLRADEAEARAMGVRGVPFARIGDRRLSGAQGQATYALALSACPVPAAAE